MRSKLNVASVAGFAVIALLLVFIGTNFAEKDAEVDNSRSSQKLKNFKRKAGAKPVVTIYEFRSGVPEIQVKAAQEMFVRIIDASSGLVIDAVNVRKKIEATGTSVSGVGRLAQSIFSLKGKSIPLNPDASVKSSRKEGVDKALRSCIEAAVFELAQRLGED
jgi:hypothetical protein